MANDTMVTVVMGSYDDTGYEGYEDPEAADPQFQPESRACLNAPGLVGLPGRLEGKQRRHASTSQPAHCRACLLRGWILRWAELHLVLGKGPGCC